MSPPQAMKALRIHGPLDMRSEEGPVPPVGPEQGLGRTAAVGICATDIELYEGRMPYLRQGLTRLPITPGHEWSGIVEQAGAGVQNLRPGDVVVGDISLGCGQCLSCLRGAYHLCERRTELGVIKEDGAFAHFLRPRARHVYPVPEGLGLEEAALAEPAATCLNGLRRTGVGPGDRAAVFGDGVIGFLTAQMCRCLGASAVVLIAPGADHRAVADELGLTLLDASSADVQAEVPRLLGGRPEVVSECSGSPEALNEAIHLTAPGGRLNVLSITGSPALKADVDYLVTRDITLVGSLASPNAFVPALRLLASGALKAKPLISRIFPFREALEAFEFVRLRREPRIKVLVVAEKKESAA